MSKTNTVQRRLMQMVPLPTVPVPKPSSPPDVVLNSVNPDAGNPVTQAPPVAPGMLPMTSAEPVYDVTKSYSSPTVDEGFDTGWKGALQRALVGFNKGVSRVQIDPTYNPIGAGLIGGAAAIGADQENSINRRLAMAVAARKPRDEAQAAALKTSAEQQALVPFKQREQQDMLNRELALANEKAKMGKTPEEIETTARNLVGVPPSMWSQLLGRSTQSRAAIFNRVAELQGKTPQEIESGYQIGKSAGIAAAGFNAAGKGQQTARAANSVKILLPGLIKASDDFARANFPLMNTAISALDVNTGGTKAIALKQYLTDTKLKMASALMQGGVPTDQATNIINTAFPDGLSVNQMREAVKNIGNIMDTQIKGGLTAVSLTPSGEAPGTTPEAPRAPQAASGWAGGAVHTYPDGTQAKFVNGKWVRVP